MRLQDAPAKRQAPSAKQQALSAKQEVGPVMLIAAIVIVILLLSFMGWRSFGHQPGQMDQATVDAHAAAKRASEGGHLK